MKCIQHGEDRCTITHEIFYWDGCVDDGRTEDFGWSCTEAVPFSVTAIMSTSMNGYHAIGVYTL